MKALLHVALLIALVSCTTQIENMKRPDGSSYMYVLNKVGGQAAGESSSGTKLVVNDENSFATAMQTAGIAFAGWTAASVTKAMEITKQVAAGEITKQQAAAGLKEVQLAELAAKSEATSEALPLATEVIVNPITPP